MRARGLNRVLMLFGIEVAANACGSLQSSCDAVIINAITVAPVDMATGQSLCDATVTITPICDAARACGGGPTTIAPNGQCSYYGGMSSGTFQVSVTAPGYIGAAQQVDVAADERCNTPKTQHINISLNRMQ
jgi:hypothetical protein